MPEALTVYILEEAGLSKGALSAYTTRFRTGAQRNALALYHTFSTAAELERGLLRLAEAIAKPHCGRATDARTHLIIISAHGAKLTGTRLTLSGADESDQSASEIDLKLHEDYFRTLPVQCVIYLSVCWGAYPGPIGAICGHSKTSSQHILIGPLVEIHWKHAVEAQNNIIDSILSGADIESKFIALIEKWNNRWFTNYVKPAMRVVTLDGKWIPEQGKAGLATEIYSAKCEVVALQGGNEQNPTYAILHDDKSFLEVRLAGLLAVLNKTEIGREDLIGTWLDIRAKVSFPALAPSFAGRAEILKATRLLEPPAGRARYVPLYPHMRERAHGSAHAGVEMTPEAIGRACGACNWAALRWTNVISGNERRPVVSAGCRRDSCPEREPDSSQEEPGTT
ncbi:hypothetical protein [Sorangium sp. So ce1153]|uniref:hypothetical protein n=1 Tax=Sorangium sp. So ce1153 TaxID=3133333 RepID=UPI003F6222F8